MIREQMKFGRELTRPHQCEFGRSHFEQLQFVRTERSGRRIQLPTLQQFGEEHTVLARDVVVATRSGVAVAIDQLHAANDTRYGGAVFHDPLTVFAHIRAAVIRPIGDAKLTNPVVHRTSERATAGCDFVRESDQLLGFRFEFVFPCRARRVELVDAFHQSLPCGCPTHWSARVLTHELTALFAVRIDLLS